MEKEGDPFYWPCYMTIWPVAGAALLVLGLGHPVEDRGCSSEASLELLEEAQPFISPLLESWITWEARLGC